MKYQEAMKYITEVGNFGSNYGLERTYKLLELLDNPQDKLKIIHVAGTNGKGSTTAMITSMLKGCGYKVGMYTSPFLEEFEERIQINGENIPKEKLAQLITKIKYAVDKVIEEGYNHPTEFEIITVLMFLYFATEEVDFAVVEVGLGGRLDSTNVITPILSVITSISFDHTNLLGNTLEEIATEKAGIIKSGIPTVIYPQEEVAEIVISSKCQELDSKLYKINKEDAKLINIIKEDKIYQQVKVKLDDEYDVKLPLLGEHQILNLAVALKALEVIKDKAPKLNMESIVKSIATVRWNGRLEIMSNSPYVVIDGAHNIQGIIQLNKNINKYFEYKDMYLILGILADKDVEDMVKVITPKAKKVFTVTPNSMRAETAEELMNEVKKYNESCEAYNDYKNAFEDALKLCKKDDLLLISGSLYMIGEMRGIIKKNTLVNNTLFTKIH